jgi:hypothetical protein
VEFDVAGQLSVEFSVELFLPEESLEALEERT